MTKGSDTDTLAATVRGALLAHSGKWLGGRPMESPALAALAALVEHARTLERERDEALAANEGKANLILHDALIARAETAERELEEAQRNARHLTNLLDWRTREREEAREQRDHANVQTTRYHALAKERVQAAKARADRYESHLKEIRAAARFKHYRSIELMTNAALEDAS